MEIPSMLYNINWLWNSFHSSFRSQRQTKHASNPTYK